MTYIAYKAFSNAKENKQVLSKLWNASNVGEDFTDKGRSFQSLGAATEIAQSPLHFKTRTRNHKEQLIIWAQTNSNKFQSMWSPPLQNQGHDLKKKCQKLQTNFIEKNFTPYYCMWLKDIFVPFEPQMEITVFSSRYASSYMVAAVGVLLNESAIS